MEPLSSLSDGVLDAIERVERVESALALRDPKAVIVWRFDEAPANLRALSRHGGDEDWLAVLPPNQTAPMWASPGSPFGVCDVSEHELVDGRMVLIGAHS